MSKKSLTAVDVAIRKGYASRLQRYASIFFEQRANPAHHAEAAGGEGELGPRIRGKDRPCPPTCALMRVDDSGRGRCILWPNKRLGPSVLCARVRRLSALVGRSVFAVPERLPSVNGEERATPPSLKLPFEYLFGYVAGLSVSSASPISRREEMRPEDMVLVSAAFC